MIVNRIIKVFKINIVLCTKSAIFLDILSFRKGDLEIMGKRGKFFLLSLVASILLIVAVGCTNNKEESAKQENNYGNMDMGDDSNKEENMENMDHSDMGMHSSSDLPKNLKEEENPTYKVGSKAIIQEGHMEGMKGAEATIVGAYHTIAYTVSYTPTNGGEIVENHKWVIHEEIENPNKAKLDPGTEVVINAEHMTGMDGAKAIIDSAEETTVYMIDFTSTKGEEVKNHKWVTEGELSPVK